MMEVLKALASHWALTGGLAVVVAVFVWLAVSLGPAWLLTHWAVVLDTVVVLVAGAVILWLYVLLEQQRVATSTAEANYQTTLAQARVLEATNRDQAGAIVRQSASVAQAASESEARSRAAGAAIAAAEKRGAADRKTIAALRARAADPKTNQGTCDEEIAHLRAAL